MSSNRNVQTQQWHPHCFAGGFGAVAPFLLRFAVMLISPLFGMPAGVLSWSSGELWGSIVGLAILAVLGAVVAFYFREGHVKKSFVLGLSAPGLLLGLFMDFSKQTQSSEATPIVTAPADSKAISLLHQTFVPTPLFAQQSPGRAVRQGSPSDSFFVRVAGCEAAERQPIRLIARMKQVAQQNEGDAPAAIALPVDCRTAHRFATSYTTFQIAINGYGSNAVNVDSIVSRRDTVLLKLDVKRQGFLAGLLRIFGRDVPATQPILTTPTQ